MKIGDAITLVRTTMDGLNKVANQPTIKRVVNVGTKVFDSLAPAFEKPGPIQIARSAFAIGKIIMDDAEVWTHEYFDSEDWIEPCSRMISEVVFSLMKNHPDRRSIKTSEGTSAIFLVTIDGVTFGFTYYVNTMALISMLVSSDKVEKARDIVSHILWEKYGSKSLVLNVAPFQMMDTSSSKRHVFNVDNMHDALESEQATRYATYIKRCLDADVHRCVMLKGPPGTGKSTMAQTIISILGLRSFRIKVGDLDGNVSTVVYDIISLFKPEALIIDDFDRIHNQTAALDVVEFFKKNVKLVIVSVNNVSRLEDALLRPGRFDELIDVDRMDEGVVKKVLGEYQDGFEFVKEWPIAFIQEYVARRKFMSSEDAEQSMLELANRARTLGRSTDRSWSDVFKAGDQSNDAWQKEEMTRRKYGSNFLKSKADFVLDEDEVDE